MIPFSLGLDLALCVTLLGLAWRTIVTPSPFRAVMYFVVYGLVMGLTWARLGAPDIALAEVALGAGLTGALLLSTVAALRRRGDRVEG